MTVGIHRLHLIAGLRGGIGIGRALAGQSTGHGPLGIDVAHFLSGRQAGAGIGGIGASDVRGVRLPGRGRRRLDCRFRNRRERG